MKKCLSILLIFFNVINGFQLRMTSINDFSKYCDLYKKKYITPINEEIAYQNFCTNMRHIQRINNQQSSYSVGWNDFTDQSIDFIKEMKLKFIMENTNNNDHFTSLSNNIVLPNKIDWKQKDKVRNVKNQGNCGSCWAFSTVGALESMIDINCNKKINLSEQELVDCSQKNYGCNGGWMHEAMNHIIKNNGLYSEYDYPYIGNDINQCKNLNNTKIIESGNFKPIFVKKNCCSSLQKALAFNTVCIALDANDYGFLFYKDGVYDRNLSPTISPNHAVLLTGYDTEYEIPKWTIKNSWGESWGRNGYMDIKMLKGNNIGVAAMYSYSIFPLYLGNNTSL